MIVNSGVSGVRWLTASPADLFSKWRAHFSFRNLPCPVCRGPMIRHGYYNRILTWPASNQYQQKDLRIQRCRCKCCGRTHAILPDFIVPWGRYPRPLILLLLLLQAGVLTSPVVQDLYTGMESFLDPASVVRTLFLWKRRVRNETETLGWDLAAFRSPDHPLPAPPVPPPSAGPFLLAPVPASVPAGLKSLARFPSRFSLFASAGTPDPVRRTQT